MSGEEKNTENTESAPRNIDAEFFKLKDKIAKKKEELRELVQEGIECDGQLSMVGKNSPWDRKPLVRKKSGINVKIGKVKHAISEMNEGLSKLVAEKATKEKVTGGDLRRAKMAGEGCRVTDHAIVRWLERVHRVDVDALRRKVWDEAQSAKPDPVRSVHVGVDMARNPSIVRKYGDGKVFVVDVVEEIVVTVWPDEPEYGQQGNDD